MKRDGRKLSSSQQELMRKIAVEMVWEQGFSKVDTARALGVSRQNVTLWGRRYAEGGPAALKLGQRGRRPQEQAKLKGWQCGVMVTLIRDHTPDPLKLPFVLWTAAAVRDLVIQRFAVTLPLRTMRKYLAPWNFTPQKPVRKAWKQCPAAVKRWLEERYPALARRAKKRQATISWVDETGLTNPANSQRGSAPRGQTPELKHRGTQFKINLIRGITNRGEVRFMGYASTRTPSKFILFLAKLRPSTKGRVVVITDHLRVQHGTRVLQWVEERKDEIELEFIPSYSPELNADEYLNRDIKNNGNAKRSPRTAKDLKDNVTSFMHRIQKQPIRTRKYFHGRHIAYAA
jgi:transposase